MLDFLTKPVRGIGRMLRGNFREGIDDLGDGVKAASLPLSFVNPLAGGLARGVGEVMDNAEEGVGNMKLGKDILAPAAMTAGAGYAGRGIGKMLSGGGAVGAPMDPTMPVDQLLPLQEGAGAMPELSAVKPPMAMPKPAGSGIGSMLGKAGNYIKDNPLEVGSLALQTFGMMQPTPQEEMMDEERRRRRQWSEILAPALGGR
jgi:hypothetical protein